MPKQKPAKTRFLVFFGKGLVVFLNILSPPK
jgi:hypothetical protein